MLTKILRALPSLILLAASSPLWSATPADYSWSTSKPQNVSTVAWTPQQIGDFLNSATRSELGYVVGDFAFVDLLGNGNLQLAALIDTNGRGFFNDLVIVRRGRAGIAIQTIPVLNMESLAGAIADLNGDGMRELIVAKRLTPYLGGTVDQANWTAIYAWTGALFEERTVAFSAWYAAHVLPALQAALAGAQQGGDSTAIALAQLQLDKAMRAAGGVSDTGFIFARMLAGSADPQLRIWAASQLADIGTPAALDALSTLLRDPDTRVRIFAKAAQEQSAQDHCHPVTIAVVSGGKEHIIDLDSKHPIKVNVAVARKGRGGLETKSVTFGATGYEQSLIGCNNEGKGITCSFNAANSALQIGDGVATLRAQREDGVCIVGRAPVEVTHSEREHEDEEEDERERHRERERE